MKARYIVAVDGPAGSGKSSVSREVARRLGIKYIDSGALYRAVTLHVLRTRGAIERSKDYRADVKDLSLEQRFNPDGTTRTFANGTDVTDLIRTEEIARNIGVISDDPAIRETVNRFLRDWAREESVIMDGRDIGTVVFPSADLKIFLDASVEVRSLRRVGEYREKGKTVDLNEIKKQIIQRDGEDTSRPVGRLVRAADAVYLDTSGMNKEEVITRIIEIIRGKAASGA